MFVRVELDLLSKPRFLRLARLVGSKAQALGGLVMLWGWAIQRADRSGVVDEAVDAESMGEICGIDPKEAASWFEALKSTGWVKVEDSSIKLHAWETYRRVYQNREFTRIRMAKLRADKADVCANTQDVCANTGTQHRTLYKRERDRERENPNHRDISKPGDAKPGEGCGEGKPPDGGRPAGGGVESRGAKQIAAVYSKSNMGRPLTPFPAAQIEFEHALERGVEHRALLEAASKAKGRRAWEVVRSCERPKGHADRVKDLLKSEPGRGEL